MVALYSDVHKIIRTSIGKQGKQPSRKGWVARYFNEHVYSSKNDREVKNNKEKDKNKA